MTIKEYVGNNVYNFIFQALIYRKPQETNGKTYITLNPPHKNPTGYNTAVGMVEKLFKWFI